MFFEVILVICAISISTKDQFLNVICEMNMKYVNLFLANVDKYMLVDQEDGEKSGVKTLNTESDNGNNNKLKSQLSIRYSSGC